MRYVNKLSKITDYRILKYQKFKDYEAERLEKKAIEYFVFTVLFGIVSFVGLFLHIGLFLGSMMVAGGFYCAYSDIKDKLQYLKNDLIDTYYGKTDIDEDQD